MNTELMPAECMLATLGFNWRELTSTSMKPAVVGTCLELYWWTLNLVPWIACEVDLMVKSLDLIISFSVKMELGIIGRRDTTLKELNSLTLFLTLFVRRLRVVIAYKGFKYAIRWVEERDQEWEHC